MRPRRVVAWLAAATGVLVVLHWAAMVLRFEFGRGYLWGYSERLNVDAEESFAQLLQMVQLLAIVVVLLVIAGRVRRRGGPHTLAWYGLAIGFAYLTVDESSRLHELLIVPVQRATGASGPLFFAWLIVAIPLIVVAVVLLYPLLRDLDRWTRRRFLLAGILYLAGVIGMEMVGGWWVERHDFNATYYYVLVPIEEAFEVAGQLLFLFTLLVVLARGGPVVRIEIREGRDPGSSVLGEASEGRLDHALG